MDEGKPFALAVEELAAKHPGERAWIEAYHTGWLEMVAGPIEGTRDLLQELSTRGHLLLALSNWSAETFPLVRQQEAFRFLDLFEHIYLSGTLRMKKPGAAIFEHLLRDADLAAENCLFIDDAAANITTARGLGFLTHHFTTPEALADDLRRHGLLD